MRRGVIGVNVTGAARHDIIRNTLSTRRFEGANHFKHTASGAGTQIDRKTFRAVEQFKRGHMSGGQVHHMDVIADAGPGGRVVVVTPHVYSFASPDRNL